MQSLFMLHIFCDKGVRLGLRRQYQELVLFHDWTNRHVSGAPIALRLTTLFIVEHTPT
jgi:hypothetical protein